MSGAAGAAAGALAGGAAGAGGDSGRAGGGGNGGSSGGNGGAGGSEAEPGWVGTWSAAAQLTEPENLPPSPGLSQNTLRQIFYVSIGGSRLRLQLSNQYGASPLNITAAHLALSTGGHGIDATTDVALAFAGSPSVTVPAGASVASDAFDFDLPSQGKVALSIAFGSTPAEVTGHPGSRTTSYLVAGNAAAAASLTSPTTTDHWYFATGIDVMADTGAAAVVALGDSITDGRGSTTNGNDRWPDALSRRLRENAATANVAVLNQGIGANAVVSGGKGPTGATRFERDVLMAPGARWVIVLFGVNDIGASTQPGVAQDLIGAYQQFVSSAHARDIKVYGVPILPFAGSSYDSPVHEQERQTVNAWIRSPGNFDAVIDLEAAVRDPQAPTQLLATYDSGDALHPNPAGYQKMADTVDLSLLTP